LAAPEKKARRSNKEARRRGHGEPRLMTEPALSRTRQDTRKKKESRGE